MSSPICPSLCASWYRALAICLAACCALLVANPAVSAQKRIYVAADDHTDYFWTADDDTYRQSFLDMLDYYLDLADTTAGNAPDYQSRFVADGSLWLWEYEHNKTAPEWNRLISRLADGHISAPMTPLVILYGASPAEAVLRSLYYAGSLERRYGLDFRMAVSMENQVLPWGLASLWAGAGAEYSWKGICGCASQASNPGNREHEIYYWVGPDSQRVLMKWNSLDTNQSMGGYAEAHNPSNVVNYVTSDAGFNSRYPYDVVGCFGVGWDALETFTDSVVATAQGLTDANRRVIVSNEVDFFEDFAATYGDTLPEVAYSYGNEWEILSASLAEVSARVKRSVESLRAAESLAVVASLYDPTFMSGRAAAREKAFLDFGLYWEHDWTADGPVPRSAREQWQRDLADEIAAYVDPLLADGRAVLSALIPLPAGDAGLARFYAWNPLGFARTEAAEIAWPGATPVHVVDVGSLQEVPSQIVDRAGVATLQVLASNLPPVGYRVYEVRAGPGQAFSAAATITDDVIENSVYRVTVAERGALLGILDKTRGYRELVRSIGGRAVNDLGAGTGTLTPVNVGPVSATLRAVSAAPLAHTTYVTLYRDGARIDLRNEITENFSAVHTWAFGFDLDAPEVHHEEVGAVALARLRTDGGNYATQSARYDWLTLGHFADVTGNDDVGITLSNWDVLFFRLGASTAGTLDTTTPQISPLAGGQVDGSGLGIQDQGGDDFFLQRFALGAHGAFDPVAAMKMSLAHQNPPLTGWVTGTAPQLPGDTFSAVEIDNPAVLLWALKPAEDGPDAGIVARLWNLAGVPETAAIQLAPSTIGSAMSATHVETDIAAMPVTAGGIWADFAAQQLRTFRLVPAEVAVNRIFEDGFETQ